MSDMIHPDQARHDGPSSAATEHGPAQHDLVGRTVVDERGERLGTVDGVFVDEDERVLYVAIDSGWYGEERHALPASALGHGPEDTLVSGYPRQAVADGPRITGTDGLTIEDLSAVHDHYGLASIDDLLAARQTTPAPTPEIAKAELATAVRQGMDPGQTVFRRWGV
jgi:hypothetical protein